MIEFIAHNLAPIMFISLVVFLLLGYPVAFSLAANGQPSQVPFGSGSDRIRPDGSIVERNTARKDNTFSAVDLRLSREFKAGKSAAIVLSLWAVILVFKVGFAAMGAARMNS